LDSIDLYPVQYSDHMRENLPLTLQPLPR
jgi:hypothetical protein